MIDKKLIFKKHSNTIHKLVKTIFSTWINTIFRKECYEKVENLHDIVCEFSPRAEGVKMWSGSMINETRHLVWNIFYLFFGVKVTFTKFVMQLMLWKKLTTVFIPTKKCLLQEFKWHTLIHYCMKSPTIATFECTIKTRLNRK